MMLNKFADWRERVISDSIEKDKGNTFNVVVMYSKTDDNYVIAGSVNDSSGVFVSSQRQEKRTFKSLDTIKRTLAGFGIHHFTVIG